LSKTQGGDQPIDKWTSICLGDTPE